MDKKTNNYLLIMVVLLLVVAVIAGAGLCYLSWADDYKPAGNGQSSGAMQDTEESGISSENGVTGEALQDAREEGRQEVLDSIRENLEANVSAEDILNGLLSDSVAGTEGTEATEPTDSTEERAAVESSEASEPLEEEGELSANTVSMNEIEISADGEYRYIKDGQVASQKGIDVSKYQKTVDWTKVAADGVEYAFIRVGCRGYGSKGTLIEDENFHQNVKGALAAGIEVGAYFFSQALTVEEALEEAELVLEHLQGYDISYPVAIDIERVQGQKARQDALTVEERTAVCIAFCERIKEAGYIPMVYGEEETFTGLLDAEQLANYDFWVCETDGTMEFPYEFAVWQYSHGGSVAGIAGDTNISISLKEW
ncbi:MAG: glycoside hydrolase family 25 protein [Lachnospiraceae bacterium]|nr:glycoside hydrolase family 25 protein [Lachnospiraceae bacterium]